MKIRYQTSVTLTEQEAEIVEGLKKFKIGTIDIFRKGLEYYAPKVSKELIKKAKEIVK